MRASADTNILVPIFTHDDETQAQLARNILRDVEQVAVSLCSLCELVRVARQNYGFALPEIANAIKFLVAVSNIAVSCPALDAELECSMQAATLPRPDCLPGCEVLFPLRRKLSHS